MSGAEDSLLNAEPRLSYDTHTNFTQSEMNVQLGDRDQGQGNAEDEAFRKENMNTAYYRDDGPSSSSERLISGGFQSMEPEVVLLSPSKQQGRVWKIVFMLFGVLIGILLSILWRTAIRTANSPSSQSKWEGWQSIEYAFIFGDSWTDTAFDTGNTPPSPGVPLGNPDFPGQNSANATNWVGFLSTKYNASLIQMYNLAVGGATLDNSIVQGYPTPVSSQVYNRFMPHYGDGHHPPWNATNSIFIMFAGVVDLIMMNGVKDVDKLSAINGNLTVVYSKLLNSLYGTGARNFLLLNMPPLERCWQPGEDGPNISEKLKSDGAVYNQRIQQAAKGLKKTFKGTNVFLLDTDKLFNQALDDPKSFPQTSRILNTTEPCMEYQSGTPTPDYLDPKCYIPVNQYFWLNGLHPTYPIHDVMAEYIAKLLESGPNIS